MSLKWETFEKDKPDLIFWQNNRGNVADGTPNRRAKELRVPRGNHLLRVPGSDPFTVVSQPKR